MGLTKLLFRCNLARLDNFFGKSINENAIKLKDTLFKT